MSQKIKLEISEVNRSSYSRRFKMNKLNIEL